MEEQKHNLQKIEAFENYIVKAKTKDIDTYTVGQISEPPLPNRRLWKGLPRIFIRSLIVD